MRAIAPPLAGGHRAGHLPEGSLSTMVLRLHRVGIEAGDERDDEQEEDKHQQERDAQPQEHLPPARHLLGLRCSVGPAFLLPASPTSSLGATGPGQTYCQVTALAKLIVLSTPDEVADEPPILQGLRVLPLQTVSGMPNAAHVGRHPKTEQRPIICKNV